MYDTQPRNDQGTLGSQHPVGVGCCASFRKHMCAFACVVLSSPTNSGEPLASSPNRQPKAQMSTFVVYMLRSRMSSGAR